MSKYKYNVVGVDVDSDVLNIVKDKKTKKPIEVTLVEGRIEVAMLNRTLKDFQEKLPEYKQHSLVTEYKLVNPKDAKIKYEAYECDDENVECVNCNREIKPWQYVYRYPAKKELFCCKLCLFRKTSTDKKADA